MIPLKLTLAGIYSYQNEQTIAFEPLLESGLFGIFGSVGSGKSTILEAITFALYRKTERLSRNDGINYNMMNLKSNRLKIDFECLNYENERWRFFIEGKRNGKRFDDVKFDATRILQYINGAWEAVDDAKTEEIIGLSYDNFRRTIIIPQGQFQEFLELGSSERTKMLEEIFRLHRYDLQQEARGLLKETENALARVEGELRQYDGIDAEAITRQKKRAEQAGKELAVQQEKRDVARGKAEQARQTLQKIARRDELRQERAGLEQQQQDVQKKEDGLRRYESCRNQFSETLVNAERLKKELAEKEAAFTKATASEAETRASLQALETEQAQQAEAFAQRDELKKRLAEYEVLKNLLETQKQRETAEAELKALEEKAVSANKQLQDAREQKAELRSQIRSEKARLPDENLLLQLQDWFSKDDGLRAELQKLRAEQHEKQEEMKALEARLARHARIWMAEAELTISERASGDAALAVEGLNTEWKQLSARRDALQDALTEQKAHHKLEEFARDLQDGRACPLCGATAHPAPLESGTHSEKITLTETELSRIKTLLETLSELIQDCRLLDSNMQQLQADLSRIAERIAEKQDELTRHKEAFNWPGFSPEAPEKLSEEQQRNDALKNQIAQLETKLEQAEDTITLIEPEQRETGKKLSTLQNELSGRKATEESYRNQLKHLEAGQYAGWSADAITQEERQLQEKLHQQEAAQQELERREKALNNRLAEAKSSVSFTQQALEKAQQELAANDGTLQQKLASSEFGTLDEVRQLLATSPDAEAIRRETKAFDQRWTAVTTALESLEQELGGQEIGPAEVEQAEEKAAALTQTCEQLLTEADAARREAERLEEKFMQKQEKEQEKQRLDERQEHLKTMTGLFSARGFVNYISSVYLRQLCEAANARFHRLTNQQFKLELDKDNGFRVRDYLSGGQVRSVKTLSGGQTFQASLCLALALAESVQQDSKTKQNFFFLDEGFGSLDQETLHIVFDTLKALRKERRVVGVISHVEALQQEMDVHLLIKNDREQGSIIHESWR